jgi:hypothetical protein
LDTPDAEIASFRQHFPSLMTVDAPRAACLLALTLWLKSNGTLPRPSRMDLSKPDLYKFVFAGTSQRYLPLQATTWQHARLDQVEFSRADLSAADFTDARACLSTWLDCRLTNARFEGADLQGSIWRNITVPNSILNKTNLRDARAIACRVNDKAWQLGPIVPFDQLHLVAFRSLLIPGFEG